MQFTPKGFALDKFEFKHLHFYEIKKVYVIGRTQKYTLMREILEDGFKLAEIEVAFHEKSEYAICMGTI